MGTNLHYLGCCCGIWPPFQHLHTAVGRIHVYVGIGFQTKKSILSANGLVGSKSRPNPAAASQIMLICTGDSSAAQISDLTEQRNEKIQKWHFRDQNFELPICHGYKSALFGCCCGIWPSFQHLHTAVGRTHAYVGVGFQIKISILSTNGPVASKSWPNPAAASQMMLICTGDSSAAQISDLTAAAQQPPLPKLFFCFAFRVIGGLLEHSKDSYKSPCTEHQYGDCYI